MLEKDIGTKLVKSFGKHLWKSQKFWGSEMQRSLPDYLIWKDENDFAPFFFELKRADDLEKAIESLTDNKGQYNKLRSFSKTKFGAALVWGSEDGKYGGVAFFKDEEFTFTWSTGIEPQKSIEAVTDQIADVMINYLFGIMNPPRLVEGAGVQMED